MPELRARPRRGRHELPCMPPVDRRVRRLVPWLPVAKVRRRPAQARGVANERAANTPACTRLLGHAAAPASQTAVACYASCRRHGAGPDDRATTLEGARSCLGK